MTYSSRKRHPSHQFNQQLKNLPEESDDTSCHRFGLTQISRNLLNRWRWRWRWKGRLCPRAITTSSNNDDDQNHGSHRYQEELSIASGGGRTCRSIDDKRVKSGRDGSRGNYRRGRSGRNRGRNCCSRRRSGACKKLVPVVVVWFVSNDEKVREFGLRNREALPR